MQILIFINELFAFVDIPGVEKLIQIFFEFIQDSLNSFSYSFSLLWGSLFYLLLQFEYVGHKPSVLNMSLIVDVDSVELHLSKKRITK